MKGDKLKVAVEDLSTNERIAWQHRLAGLSAAEAAAQMGCDLKQVRALWRNARARKKPSKAGRIDMALSAAGRCWCGLLLPCVCLPTIYEVASSRRDGGMMSVTTAGSISGNASSGAR